jgi:lipid-A-disaccharide synthase
MAKKYYKIFCIAGEASGDTLAADLINSLTKENIEFSGVCGPKMQEAAACRSIFPMHNLAITGYAEIIPKIFLILYRFAQTIYHIRNINPDIVITIDAPGFNFQLVKFLKRFLNLKARFIHYVAPTVWAYKPERAKICAELFDHMLVILPFETKYFKAVGMSCDYVGNAATAKITVQNERNKHLARNNFSISENKLLISIFPGSRQNELKKHLPIIKEFINLMRQKNHNIIFFIPTLAIIKNQIQSYLQASDIVISADIEVKELMLTASDLIIAKSGTSVTESVSRFIPTIMFYQVSKFTAWLLKRKIKIKYFTICNIMMDKEIIPELLQENFNANRLESLSEKLLFDNTARTKQIDAMQRFAKKFNKSNNMQPVSKIIKSYLKI